jgi:hypothetical protein
MILNTADLLTPSIKHYIINDKAFRLNETVVKSNARHLLLVYRHPERAFNAMTFGNNFVEML